MLFRYVIIDRIVISTHMEKNQTLRFSLHYPLNQFLENSPINFQKDQQSQKKSKSFQKNQTQSNQNQNPIKSPLKAYQNLNRIIYGFKICENPQSQNFISQTKKLQSYQKQENILDEMIDYFQEEDKDISKLCIREYFHEKAKIIQQYVINKTLQTYEISEIQNFSNQNLGRFYKNLLKEQAQMKNMLKKNKKDGSLKEIYFDLLIFLQQIEDLFHAFGFHNQFKKNTKFEVIHNYQRQKFGVTFLNIEQQINQIQFKNLEPSYKFYKNAKIISQVKFKQKQCLNYQQNIDQFKTFLIQFDKYMNGQFKHSNELIKQSLNQLLMSYYQYTKRFEKQAEFQKYKQNHLYIVKLIIGKQSNISNVISDDIFMLILSQEYQNYFKDESKEELQKIVKKILRILQLKDKKSRQVLSQIDSYFVFELIVKQNVMDVLQKFNLIFKQEIYKFTCILNSIKICQLLTTNQKDNDHLNFQELIKSLRFLSNASSKIQIYSKQKIKVKKNKKRCQKKSKSQRKDQSKDENKDESQDKDKSCQKNKQDKHKSCKKKFFIERQKDWIAVEQTSVNQTLIRFIYGQNGLPQILEEILTFLQLQLLTRAIKKNSQKMQEQQEMPKQKLDMYYHIKNFAKKNFKRYYSYFENPRKDEYQSFKAKILSYIFACKVGNNDPQFQEKKQGQQQSKIYSLKQKIKLLYHKFLSTQQQQIQITHRQSSKNNMFRKKQHQQQVIQLSLDNKTKDKIKQYKQQIREKKTNVKKEIQNRIEKINIYLYKHQKQYLQDLQNILEKDYLNYHYILTDEQRKSKQIQDVLVYQGLIFSNKFEQLWKLLLKLIISIRDKENENDNKSSRIWQTKTIELKKQDQYFNIHSYYYFFQQVFNNFQRISYQIKSHSINTITQEKKVVEVMNKIEQIKEYKKKISKKAYQPLYLILSHYFQSKKQKKEEVIFQPFSRTLPQDEESWKQLDYNNRIMTTQLINNKLYLSIKQITKQQKEDIVKGIKIYQSSFKGIEGFLKVNDIYECPMQPKESPLKEGSLIIQFIKNDKMEILQEKKQFYNFPKCKNSELVPEILIYTLKCNVREIVSSLCQIFAQYKNIFLKKQDIYVENKQDKLVFYFNIYHSVIRKILCKQSQNMSKYDFLSLLIETIERVQIPQKGQIYSFLKNNKTSLYYQLIDLFQSFYLEKVDDYHKIRCNSPLFMNYYQKIGLILSTGNKIHSGKEKKILFKDYPQNSLKNYQFFYQLQFGGLMENKYIKYGIWDKVEDKNWISILKEQEKNNFSIFNSEQLGYYSSQFKNVSQQIRYQKYDYNTRILGNNTFQLGQRLWSFLHYLRNNLAHNAQQQKIKMIMEIEICFPRLITLLHRHTILKDHNKEQFNIFDYTQNKIKLLSKQKLQSQAKSQNKFGIFMEQHFQNKKNDYKLFKKLKNSMKQFVEKEKGPLCDQCEYFISYVVRQKIKDLFELIYHLNDNLDFFKNFYELEHDINKKCFIDMRTSQNQEIIEQINFSQKKLNNHLLEVSQRQNYFIYNWCFYLEKQFPCLFDYARLLENNDQE